MKLDDLQQMLDLADWRYESQGSDCLLTGVEAKDGVSLPIVMGLSGDILRMSITFILEGSETEDLAQSALAMLGRNSLWPLVKVGLDEDRNMVLMADLVVTEMSYVAFSVALEIFCEVAELFSLEFRSILHDGGEADRVA